MFKTMFFFSVQLCVDPWTVLRQADLQMYKFNWSLELSLLPCIEKYRSSTFFLCPTTHDSDRFGWIMVAGGVRLIPAFLALE
jgi:hypothetical protein